MCHEGPSSGAEARPVPCDHRGSLRGRDDGGVDAYPVALSTVRSGSCRDHAGRLRKGVAVSHSFKVIVMARLTLREKSGLREKR